MFEVKFYWFGKLDVSPFTERCRYHFCIEYSGCVFRLCYWVVVRANDRRSLGLWLEDFFESIERHEDQPHDSVLTVLQKSAASQLYDIVGHCPLPQHFLTRENLELVVDVPCLKDADRND